MGMVENMQLTLCAAIYQSLLLRIRVSLVK
jgi:hypothetical protein